MPIYNRKNDFVFRCTHYLYNTLYPSVTQSLKRLKIDDNRRLLSEAVRLFSLSLYNVFAKTMKLLSLYFFLLSSGGSSKRQNSGKSSEPKQVDDPGGGNNRPPTLKHSRSASSDRSVYREGDEGKIANLSNRVIQSWRHELF